MEHSVGQYLAVYFDDVSSAIEYCHRLLPQVVPHSAVPMTPEAERSVVWLHVPRRSTATTRDGCYLFVSAGALHAADRASMETVVSGVVPHSALPVTSVLVLGDDSLDRVTVQPAPRKDGIAPRPSLRLQTTVVAQTSRL